MKPVRLTIAALSALVVCAAASPVRAASPAGKGLAIIEESDRRDAGFGDVSAAVTMILRNRQGQESRREFRFSSLEVEDDGDKTLIVFETPPDIQSTALLTFTHKTESDDQWLYLPALKRVKRIAASNKSGSFVGSEFAYEDMTSQEVEKYTYRYLRNESCGALDCFVVERTPVDRKSGYSRQVVWLDTDDYRFQKVEYFDRRGDLLKMLTFDGYRQYLGRYWRAAMMNMVNHQTGKSTVLEWRDYKFRSGLGDSDFSRARLKRLK